MLMNDHADFLYEGNHFRISYFSKKDSKQIIKKAEKKFHISESFWTAVNRC